MRRHKAILILLLLPFEGYCQKDIPINNWRVHPSFYAIQNIALDGSNKVFAASRHGILLLDRVDNQLTTLTTLDGLKGSLIADLEYAENFRALIIAYSDGTFDLLDSQNKLLNFDPLATTLITGSRQINDIFIHENMVYLATDYGVVLFDIAQRQIKETWRDLSETGKTLKIIQITIKSDSAFLATERGVIGGNLDSNLQDFNNWNRFNTGDFNAPIKSISSFNGVLFCAIDGKGIFSKSGSEWNIRQFLQNEEFNSMNASATSLVVTTRGHVWKISEANNVEELANSLFVTPLTAIPDDKGNTWIGDGSAGLISELSGTYNTYRPNSPASDDISILSNDVNEIFGVSGRYSTLGIPLKKPGVIDKFATGKWSHETSPLTDITDVLRNASTGEVYAASFGYGVEVSTSNGVTKVWDESNSTLSNVYPPDKSVNVTSLAYSADGMWVTNYGSLSPLNLLRSDNNWEGFSFSEAAARYPRKIVVDLSGNVWMVLDPAHGGGIIVFNKENGSSKYLNDLDGQGSLPSKYVHAIAVDRDGLVWVGTELGAAYFNVNEAILSSPVNSIKPVVDGRFLLRDDIVTALAVDGGNRKWLGTNRGIWLYSAEGDVPLNNYTTITSPLPSDSIFDIKINDENGEVFFATSEGVASFRSGSTKTPEPALLKVFPNPVYPGFAGTVGITGTPIDAIIKITDVAGKLVWQGRANGGTAIWNVQDEKGKRVPTGVYVVFVVRDNGAQHLAAKIAVVN
ncbi:MAG: two-component regulator propeller domain-containing protein [Chryseolinea sp.]